MDVIFPLLASLDRCTSLEYEWTTNLLQAEVGVKPKHILQNKPLLARSLRDHRRTGRSEGRHHGVPSKLSSLTLEDNGRAVNFPSRRMSVSCAVYRYVFSCIFLYFFLSANVPKQVRETRRIFNQDGSDWDT